MCNETFKLKGYIEYLASPTGFVTPVFTNNSKKLYVQVDTDTSEFNWELLPSEYLELVQTISEGYDNVVGNVLTYGFKWEKGLVFGQATDLANFLVNDFLINSNIDRDLAIGFVSTFQSSTLLRDTLSATSVWQRCISVLKLESTVLAEIVLKNFDAVKYESNILTVAAQSVSAKQLFINQFKSEIIRQVASDIPGFSINVIDDFPLKENSKPIFWGGGNPTPISGSYVMPTTISHFHDFENYIVGSFNSEAYHSAIRLIDDNSSFLLTIKGGAGVGKTHFINSIANRIKKIDATKNVGIFTLLSNPSTENIVSEFEVGQLEHAASNHDVILIDDAHNFAVNTKLFQNLIKVIKKWRAAKKSVVISFRNSVQFEVLSRFSNEATNLVLDLPNQEDKQKLIQSRTNAYNIRLAWNDIQSISENDQLKNVADIQRSLTKLYLVEDLKEDLRLYDFEMTKYTNAIQYSKLKSCVISHFDIDHFYPSFQIRNNKVEEAKVISDFIWEVFKMPHHSNYLSTEMKVVDGSYYSLSEMQYYLFESKPFKEFIISIMKDLLMNDKP